MQAGSRRLVPIRSGAEQCPLKLQQRGILIRKDILPVRMYIQSVQLRARAHTHTHRSRARTHTHTNGKTTLTHTHAHTHEHRRTQTHTDARTQAHTRAQTLSEHRLLPGLNKNLEIFFLVATACSCPNSCHLWADSDTSFPSTRKCAFLRMDPVRTARTSAAKTPLSSCAQ